MTWEEYGLARQQLLEEFIGSRVREAQRAEARQASETARLARESERGNR